jgi:hypothetical protein
LGVSKGLAMKHIMAYMRAKLGPSAVEFCYVFAAGHFLSKDENVFSFLEGQGIGKRNEQVGFRV